MFAYFVLSSVQTVSIYTSHNALADLPAAIGKLTRLEVLDLSHNRLDALPVEISAVKRLVKLSLHHTEVLAW